MLICYQPKINVVAYVVPGCRAGAAKVAPATFVEVRPVGRDVSQIEKHS